MTITNSLNPPTDGTKLADLVRLLKGKGSGIDTLSTKLGWQPHTVRAAITGLRQRGYVVVTKKSQKTGLSIYRLDGSAK
ncbi:MAG: DUF3489 domain-containing protein [Pseudomonadota bacterium]